MLGCRYGWSCARLVVALKQTLAGGGRIDRRQPLWTSRGQVAVGPATVGQATVGGASIGQGTISKGAAEIGLLHGRLVLEVGGAALTDDAAVLHQVAPVGNRQALARILLNQQDADAEGTNALKRLK